jgi:hypothetical protein
MEIDEAQIIALAKARILVLSYAISKKINLDNMRDEQIICGQLCSLVRVLEDGNTILTPAQRYQILEGILIIGNL